MHPRADARHHIRDTQRADKRPPQWGPGTLRSRGHPGLVKKPFLLEVGRKGWSFPRMTRAGERLSIASLEPPFVNRWLSPDRDGGASQLGRKLEVGVVISSREHVVTNHNRHCSSLRPHDGTGGEREVDGGIEPDVDHAEPFFARTCRVIRGLEGLQPRLRGHARQLALTEYEAEAPDHLTAPQRPVDHDLAFRTARHRGMLKLASGEPGKQG